MRLEETILENLLHSDEYFRKVIPHLDVAYFDSNVEKTLLKFIKTFSDKYNKAPNQKILSLMVKEYNAFTQEEFVEAQDIVDRLNGVEENRDWLVNETEKFCQDKSVYNAIMEAITIIDGKNKELDQGAIPKILQDALSISFDKSVGHDFFDNAESRYDFYHAKEDRIPFKLDYFNKITKGGTPRKTLNCILAGINVGKSLFLCDIAASSLSQGYNVLYITLEMAEERIAERIDCNLLNVSIDNLARIKKDDFLAGVKGIESATHGKLVIKEYPTGGAHVGHFKALIEELKLKKNFIPDVICVDYVNICASQKYKSTNYNSYFAIKAIAEELRGLMVEYNCAGWTATQLTRSGISDTDFDMTDTSESMGLPASLDFFFGIMRTEELDAMSQLMVKQLKSRYGDVGYYRKFLIGIELAKFKLHNVDESQQGQLSDAGKTDTDKPLFDRSIKHDFSSINFE